MVILKDLVGNLFASITYLIACICNVIASIVQKNTVSKYLYAVAAICFLIGGVGFFFTFLNERKKMKRKNKKLQDIIEIE